MLHKFWGMPVNFLHSLILDYQGEAYATGAGEAGQLGLGDNLGRTIWSQISAPVKFKSVVAGYSCHSLGVAEDGTLWSWGSNALGQLGLSETIRTATIPTKIPELSDIISVVAGENFTLALNSQGDVWGFGSNKNGALGFQSSDTYVRTPIKNPHLNNIQMLSAGSNFSVALDNSGIIWVFGTLRENKKVIPAQASSCDVPIVSISCGYYHFLAVDIENQLWGWGITYWDELGLQIELIIEPQKIVFGNGVSEAVCGGGFSFIRDLNRKVWVFGYKNHGELGMEFTSTKTIVENPTLQEMITLLPAGDHSFCVDAQGFLWGTGSNNRGQLGLGNAEEQQLFTCTGLQVFNPISRVKSAKARTS